MDTEIDFTQLEKNLGYKFRTKKLCTRALTRKAYAKEQMDKGRRCDDQNALCVLGDAVLDAIITEKLTDQGLDKKGEITEERKQYVSREALHRVAKELKLYEFILTNKSEGVGPGRSRILAETLEAVIGAMFLDSDYEKTKIAVLKWFRI